MSAQRFKPGQTFVWQGVLYEVRQLLADGHVNMIALDTGATQTVAAVQLVQAILTDELHFTNLTAPEPPPVQSGAAELADYSPQQRAVAEYRLSIIQPLLALPPQERGQAIEARVQKLNKKRQPDDRNLLTAISVSSVYRWIKIFKQSKGDLRSLMPNTPGRGGGKKTRLAADVEAIITATIDDHYFVRERRNLNYIHREVAVRLEEENQRRRSEDQLSLPSPATIGRRLQALSPQTKLEAKQGRRTARHQLTQYQSTDYPTIPLERVEIDHTRTDLVVIDEHDYLPLGRLTLTHSLDTATRYPLGYYLGFEPPSYLAVMSCLYHTICPKQNIQSQYGTQHPWLAYGIPYTLVVDNGKEFIGRDLEDACYSLGITLQQTPVKTPYFKAAVERMFGTINTGLLHTLPGTTFSNPRQRGDYESLKQACITMGDLEQLLHLFLLDIYAEDFHRGLQDIPARRWEKLTDSGFFPRVPTSATQLRILLGRVTYRTIQHYGIDLHTLRYNSPNLAPLRQRMKKRNDKQVKVKYDPTDLSRIYVFDPDEQRYLEVPALAEAYTQGLSLWKHQVIRNFVLSRQDRVDIVALGRAQRQIQAIVEESLQHKKLGTRTKIARWQHGGQPVDSSPQNLIQTEATPKILLPEVVAPPPLDFDLHLDPEKLEAEGWQVSYKQPQTGQEGGTTDD
jgi:putative transposase